VSTATLDATVMGSQTPTIRHVPAMVSSSGHEVITLAAKAGLHLDPWQRQVLIDAMGERADGKWSAFEAAVIVARQNGKSAIFEARCLAGLFLFNEELLIYSAHEFKTAQEIFRRILALIRANPAFSRRVKMVSRSKGDEGIELLPTPECPDGQRLRFVARSTGSGRGFSGDLNIWDECQNLGDAPVDALMPTMLARPNAQLWYGGSAPDKNLAPCEQITRVRVRALAGGDVAGDLAYFEWSARLCDETCESGCVEHDDRDSPVTWAKTNPALGHRIKLEMVARLHGSMSRAGFNREILSVGNYPTVDGGWDVISEAAWTAVADENSRALDPIAFAVEVSPDRNAASIAAAGVREDGLIHVEVVDYRPGTSWVPDRMAQLIGRWKPCAVAIAPAGPSGSLVADLEDAGIELVEVKGRETTAACGALYDAVVRPPDAEDGWAPSLRQRPHPALTAAVAGATKRVLGDAWAWNRRNTSVDPSPLVAVTLARYAWATRPREVEAVVPLVVWR